MSLAWWTRPGKLALDYLDEEEEEPKMAVAQEVEDDDELMAPED